MQGMLNFKSRNTARAIITHMTYLFAAQTEAKTVLCHPRKKEELMEHTNWATCL